MGRPKKIQTETKVENQTEQSVVESANEEYASCAVPVTLDPLEEITPVVPALAQGGIIEELDYPKLKVKLVDKHAKLPERANPTDAGADLFATTEMVIGAKCSKFMDLGVQIQLPKGTFGLITARSGLGGKGIRPRNCVGIIDEKYFGNIGIMIENNGDNSYRISTGDRIAQLLVLPVFTPEIESVSDFDRTDYRNGGFGSTGR